MKQKIATLLLLLFFAGPSFPALAVTKVTFPFTPISAASLPWWVAKESHYYEKHGLEVDMIYVGASPVIIQAMLGGQVGVGAGGGPPLVTNVIQGGDIVQVATTVPYAIQSLIVKSDIKTPADLAGKKIGISRLGAIPHYTLQAIVKLYNVQGINIVQTGTTTQAITSLSQGLVDGIITSAPFTFRLMKDGYRELVSPKDFKKAGVQFLIQGLVARKSFAVKNREVVIGMIKATMEGGDKCLSTRSKRSRCSPNIPVKPIPISWTRPTDSLLTSLSKIPRSRRIPSNPSSSSPRSSISSMPN